MSQKETVSKIKIFGLIVFIANLVMAGAIVGYYLYEDILNENVSFLSSSHEIHKNDLLNQVIIGAIFVGIAIANLILLGMLRHRASKLGITSIFRWFLVICLICGIALLLIQILFFVLYVSVYIVAKFSETTSGIDVETLIGGGFGKFLGVINNIIDNYINKYFITFIVSAVSFALLVSTFISWLIGLGIHKKSYKYVD